MQCFSTTSSLPILAAASAASAAPFLCPPAEGEYVFSLRRGRRRRGCGDGDSAHMELAEVAVICLNENVLLASDNSQQGPYSVMLWELTSRAT